MAKWKMSDEEFERQYAEAVKRGKEKTKNEPQARSVSYDLNSERLIIEFKNGVTLAVPRSLLPELDGADPDLIAEVELRPRGAALHWTRLNQDFSIAGLMASIFSNDVLMSELGRRGGSISSEAKAAAARANGQKGGRPLRRTNFGGEFFEAFMVKQLGFTFADVAKVEPASPEAPLGEIIEAERTLSNADRFALKKTGDTQVVKGWLVNRSKPAISEGTLAPESADDFLIRDDSRGNEENGNENLTLAA